MAVVHTPKFVTMKYVSENAAVPRSAARSKTTNRVAGGGQTIKAQELGLVAGAEPTRTWKPGKVWVARDGIFPKTSKCLNTYAPFESSLEAVAHLLLSVDPRIQHYVCQPPPLHYWMPGNDGGMDKREYTPDFVALTRDGRLLVIDAKASFFANDAKWLNREPCIRQAYRRDYDAELLVWNEHDLRAEPRLSNARTMYRHRFAPSDRGCDFALMGALEERGGQSSIGELCDCLGGSTGHDAPHVFGAIMRAGLEGLVRLESSARYGLSTIVSLPETGA